MAKNVQSERQSNKQSWLCYKISTTAFAGDAYKGMPFFKKKSMDMYNHQIQDINKSYNVTSPFTDIIKREKNRVNFFW